MSALNVLALETSSAEGSIALATAGGRGDCVAERIIATPRQQTATILGLIDELLNEAGIGVAALDAIVLGRGPGSFTGLRIAAAVAQGLGFSAAIPIVSVSSLAALALRGFTEHLPGAAGTDVSEALCLVDARMGEVYSCCFSWNGRQVVPISEEGIGPAERVAAPIGSFLAIGDGIGAYAERLAAVLAAARLTVTGVWPRARDLLVLAEPEVEAGRFVALESALPVYLREASAWRRS